MALTWLGLVLAGLGLIASYLFYRWSQRPKRLEYRADVDQLLIRPGAQPWRDLQVVYAGVPLGVPRLVVVRITNAGAVEVRKDDWEDALSVQFHDRVVTAALLLHLQGERPTVQELEPVYASAGSVTAPQVLLNPGDWLEFRLLLDGNRGSPAVGGRIAGAALVAAGPARAESLRTGLRWLRRPRRIQSGILAGFAIAVGAASAIMGFFSVGFGADPNAGRPEVPAILGQPLDVATKRLADAGLRTENVILVEAESPANTVIAVSPPPGEQAPADGSVDVIIAK